MISRFKNTTKQAFKQIGRNGAMTFASVFAITAMLLILGLFFVVIINVNMATESIKGDYNNIEVYMKDSTSEKVILKDMTTIEKWGNVKNVDYRSKEDAFKILKERWGDSGYLLDSLGENPLPNSIVITVKNLEKASDISEKSKDLSGVEDVKYYKDTVDKLLKATNVMQWAAIILILFLIVVSTVVVANTIKLTVLNRSEEISIMKYVGATNWFIRGPFLLEGIIIGAFSALLSSGIVLFIYSRIIASVGNELLTVLSVPLVPIGFLAFNLILIFLALGISIGSWGSIISMRRFLDT